MLAGVLATVDPGPLDGAVLAAVPLCPVPDPLAGGGTTTASPPGWPFAGGLEAGAESVAGAADSVGDAVADSGLALAPAVGEAVTCAATAVVAQALSESWLVCSPRTAAILKQYSVLGFRLPTTKTFCPPLAVFTSATSSVFGWSWLMT